jgi:SAM-dependent methyltransferase
MKRLTEEDVLSNGTGVDFVVERLDGKPAEQHLVEMRANREVWGRKPLLRTIYSEFYRLIRSSLTLISGPIVELGSGIGAVKEFIPDCVTTDIFPNPWIDRRENAYALNFQNESLSNLILLDVFHHLQYPGTALNEFRRVLKPGGRIIIFEPGMGTLGKLVYGSFHHEPLGLHDEIVWLAPDNFNPDQAGYYAAQGNATRVFLLNEFPQYHRSWQVIKLQALPAIAYVASGGFSKPQLYPGAALPFIRNIEGILSRWPRIFATRLLVVLEKSRG